MFILETYKHRAEVADQEMKGWDEALLFHDIDYFSPRKVFLASLSPRSNPDISLYGLADSTDHGTSIIIPLQMETPRDQLVEEAYLQTTTLGEVDPQLYADFCKDPWRTKKIVAVLNNEAHPEAGNGNKGADWFYSSYGLEQLDRHHNRVWVSTKGAIDFVHLIQKHLPNISVNPVSIETYLQRTQETLHFLPQDWGK